MERVEQVEMISNEDVNKIQDPMFRERFKKEWEEITNTLKQIQEASKISKVNRINDEIIRPTSSSVIFK